MTINTINIFGGNSKKKELMLYYLYMMSDGEVSKEEVKFFNQICKEFTIESEKKKAIISECKELGADEEGILKVIMEKDLDTAWYANKTRVLWNLIDLGYADKFYSDPEKEIVKHLVEKWEIDEVVYQEMVDTAETMLALTRQKEWMLANLEEGPERNKMKKRIESAMKDMIADINITIEEEAL